MHFELELCSFLSDLSKKQILTLQSLGKVFNGILQVVFLRLQLIEPCFKLDLRLESIFEFSHVLVHLGYQKVIVPVDLAEFAVELIFLAAEIGLLLADMLVFKHD